MEDDSPTYSSGRLTRKELSPGSEGRQRNKRDVSSSPLHRVAVGRIAKSTSSRSSAGVASSSSTGSSPLAKRVRIAESEDLSDYADGIEDDEMGEDVLGDVDSKGDDDMIGSAVERAPKRVKRVSGGGDANYVDHPSEDEEELEAASHNVASDLIDEAFESYEDYDGGSGSDWDDFPRVRRSMSRYLVDKYRIEGSEDWTAFQAKLHKLSSLVEGYPIMLNSWKFPYFAEWAIPPSYQINSPLAPPAIRKRVVLNAHGDFFRALKALKGLFNLSSKVASYRQLDDMEHRIAPMLKKELESYWQWALQDAGLVHKEMFHNVFMIRLGLGEADGPDTSLNVVLGHEDDQSDSGEGCAQAQLTAESLASGEDDEGGSEEKSAALTNDRELGSQTNTPPRNGPVQHPGSDRTRGMLDGGDVSITLVGSPETRLPAMSRPIQLGDSILSSSPLKSTADVKQEPPDGVEQPAGVKDARYTDAELSPATQQNKMEEIEEDTDQEESAELLHEAIRELRIREYGESFRNYIQKRTGSSPPTLDFVLLVIVQHRIMTCTLDVSKPDTQPVVVTTFNMADTRQWLWNTLRVAIPIHMARDELLKYKSLWDDSIMREESVDPDL